MSDDIDGAGPAEPLVRLERIRTARLRQPIVELRRKRDKALRRDYLTQEDLDLAEVEALELLAKINFDSA